MKRLAALLIVIVAIWRWLTRPHWARYYEMRKP